MAAPTSRGELDAARVVVATGYNRTPFIPGWPGRDGYSGTLIHSSAYRNSAPYRGKEVLVIGAGNSGAEIAADLLEGGAGRVVIAVRTPPHIVPRQALGVPAQVVGIGIRRLPPGVGDVIVAALQRIFVGDLSRSGMPKTERGFYSDFLSRGVVPTLDVGLIGPLKRGTVGVVRGVESFERSAVVLADGSRISPEVVIAATGYRRGLEPLVGDLGVLDAAVAPTSMAPTRTRLPPVCTSPASRIRSAAICASSASTHARSHARSRGSRTTEGEGTVVADIGRLGDHRELT